MKVTTLFASKEQQSSSPCIDHVGVPLLFCLRGRRRGSFPGDLKQEHSASGRIFLSKRLGSAHCYQRLTFPYIGKTLAKQRFQQQQQQQKRKLIMMKKKGKNITFDKSAWQAPFPAR